RAARDLHAQPRAHADAHADLGEDLGVALRRRHEPARRLHEPPAHEARSAFRPSAVQDGARSRLSPDMRSISARLALWYALAATLTLAALFAAGHQLLRTRLVHGLDLLNAAEFTQIEARLGADYQKLDLKLINDRVKEAAESASVLFYINIHNPGANLLYYSPNLNGVPIPDIP